MYKCVLKIVIKYIYGLNGDINCSKVLEEIGWIVD